MASALRWVRGVRLTPALSKARLHGLAARTPR
jgi:hypothetical protein